MVPKYHRLLLVSEYNNHFESFKKQTKPLVPGLTPLDFKTLNVGWNPGICISKCNGAFNRILLHTG